MKFCIYFQLIFLYHEQHYMNQVLEISVIFTFSKTFFIHIDQWKKLWECGSVFHRLNTAWEKAYWSIHTIPLESQGGAVRELLVSGRLQNSLETACSLSQTTHQAETNVYFNMQTQHLQVCRFSASTAVAVILTLLLLG